MAFRIGASTYSYLYDHTMDYALEQIAGMGFRYLEILSMPPHLWAPDPNGPSRAALRSKIESLGLETIAVGPMYFDLNLASTNPSVRDASVQEVVHNLRLAADLGARGVTTIAGRRNPLFPAPMDLTWELCRDSLDQCARAGGEVGATVFLEPIIYSFINTGAEVRRMIEEIGSPWLRGMMDTANSHSVEGVIPAVEAMGPYLGHVQFSDTVRGQLRHDPVGYGDIDFKAVEAVLEKVGFTGPCVLELCWAQDPDGSLRISSERLQEMGYTL